MEIKTKAIVLKLIDYNDKNLLAVLLTRNYGKVTYIVSKSGSKKSKVKRTMFRPLAVLNIVGSHQSNNNIQKLKEVEHSSFHHDVVTDIRKISIVFFLAEILSKIIDTSQTDEHLFDFIENSLNVLEYSQKGISNFHLVMLCKLSYFLGFYPNFQSYEENYRFDMINGEFTQNHTLYNKLLSESESFYLNNLGRINFRNMHYFRLSKSDRQLILSRIIEYYRLHTYDFSDLKSLDVLAELF